VVDDGQSRNANCQDGWDEDEVFGIKELLNEKLCEWDEPKYQCNHSGAACLGGESKPSTDCADKG